MASLFTCCGSDKKTLKAEAETRRARIVSVYDHSRTASLYSIDQTHTSLPPPKYADAIRDQVIYVPTDEKSPSVLAQTRSDTPTHEQRSASPAPTISDSTSVISIPSTRLSGITSTYTGHTIRLRRRLEDNASDERRNSWRDSGIYSDYSNNAPPSYYAPSEYGTESDTSEPHPVMQGGWLERLRADAEQRVRDQHVNHV